MANASCFRGFRLGSAVLATCAVLGFVVGACAKKDQGEAPSPSASAAASLMAAPAVSSVPAAPTAGSPVLGPGETLAGHLAQEALDRPKVKPNADDLFAAFDKLGATIPQKQPSLADTYNAKYCVGGYTEARDLAITICEYADEASASAGRDLSQKLLEKVTARDVYSHKDVTLAIIQLKADSATTALKKRMVLAMNAM
jgi:hypothetical protein